MIWQIQLSGFCDALLALTCARVIGSLCNFCLGVNIFISIFFCVNKLPDFTKSFTCFSNYESHDCDGLFDMLGLPNIFYSGERYW